MELAPLITGKRCEDAWQTGDIDVAPMMMGQSVGRVYDIKPVKDIIEGMVAEAKEQLSRVQSMF